MNKFVKLALSLTLVSSFALVAGCPAQNPTPATSSAPASSATPTDAPASSTAPTDAPASSTAPTDAPAPTTAPNSSATPTSAPTASSTPTTAPTSASSSGTSVSSKAGKTIFTNIAPTTNSNGKIFMEIASDAKSAKVTVDLNNVTTAPTKVEVYGVKADGTKVKVGESSSFTAKAASGTYIFTVTNLDANFVSFTFTFTVSGITIDQALNIASAQEGTVVISTPAPTPTATSSTSSSSSSSSSNLTGASGLTGNGG